MTFYSQQSLGISIPVATTAILSRVQEVNKTITALGLSKSLPVGTSDAGSVFTLQLAQGIQYYHANGKVPF